MRAAGVLDGLGGEEEGGVGCCLVGSVLRGGGGCWGVGFAEVFEEEDYAVDGTIYSIVLELPHTYTRVYRWIDTWGRYLNDRMVSASSEMSSSN